MGIRICAGVGYGVQLTDEEKKARSDDEIFETIEQYYTKYVDRLQLNIHKNFGEVTADGEAEMFFDILEFNVKKEMTTEEKNKLVDELARTINYPQSEYGTYSFFGYIPKYRYDDPLDWAMLSILGINGDGSDIPMHPVRYTPELRDHLTNQGFLMSHPRGVEVEVPWFLLSEQVSVDKEATKFTPSMELYMNYGKELQKALKENANATIYKDIGFFSSREKCTAFLKEFFGKRGGDYPQNERAPIDWNKAKFMRAWNVIHAVYPEISFTRLHQYMIFWFA